MSHGEKSLHLKLGRERSLKKSGMNNYIDRVNSAFDFSIFL